MLTSQFAPKLGGVGVLGGTPDTYHTAGLERDRHLNFHETRDNLDLTSRKFNA